MINQNIIIDQYYSLNHGVIKWNPLVLQKIQICSLSSTFYLLFKSIFFLNKTQKNNI